MRQTVQPSQQSHSSHLSQPQTARLTVSEYQILAAHVPGARFAACSGKGPEWVDFSKTLIGGGHSQRGLAELLGMSLGKVNKVTKALEAAGLLASGVPAAPAAMAGAAGATETLAAKPASGKKEPSQGRVITAAGLAALEPYRVKNAVILAAGLGGRIAPLSYEAPKALLRVKGDVLIERLIGQLNQAGINSITVVVGYMKESFFYLSERFGVDIVINPRYATCNNCVTLRAAEDRISNTYVCSSDQYFLDNPFVTYAYAAHLNTIMMDEPTCRRLVSTNKAGVVCRVVDGGDSGPGMIGCAYLDDEASRALMEAIAEEMSHPGGDQLRWDDMYRRHLDRVKLQVRVLPVQSMYEFDRLSDLARFDVDYMDNVDLEIFDNICSLLDCQRSDISNVRPLKEGLTNLSFRFDCKGESFVYRHPGCGSEEVVNRASETFALEVARDLGLDTTYLHEDPVSGWKISRFIEGCEPFDYGNEEHVRKALEIGRRLHSCGAQSPWAFDFYEEALRLTARLKEMDYPLPGDFAALGQLASRAQELLVQHRDEPVLCHNDFFGPNFLVKGDDMWLIDWEYAAMGDWACDLGNFIAQGSGFSVEKAMGVLEHYFMRPPSVSEQVRCLAATAVVGYYWYVWAIFKEAKGNPVGDWLYVWYKAAREFATAALGLAGCMETERNR